MFGVFIDDKINFATGKAIISFWIISLEELVKSKTYSWVEFALEIISAALLIIVPDTSSGFSFDSFKKFLDFSVKGKFCKKMS